MNKYIYDKFINKVLNKIKETHQNYILLRKVNQKYNQNGGKIIYKKFVKKLDNKINYIFKSIRLINKLHINQMGGNPCEQEIKEFGKVITDFSSLIKDKFSNSKLVDEKILTELAKVYFANEKMNKVEVKIKDSEHKIEKHKKHHESLKELLKKYKKGEGKEEIKLEIIETVKEEDKTDDKEYQDKFVELNKLYEKMKNKTKVPTEKGELEELNKLINIVSDKLKNTGVPSTVASSTVAQSTGVPSTVAQSTGAQSTGAQSTVAQSTVALAIENKELTELNTLFNSLNTKFKEIKKQIKTKTGIKIIDLIKKRKLKLEYHVHVLNEIFNPELKKSKEINKKIDKKNKKTIKKLHGKKADAHMKKGNYIKASKQLAKAGKYYEAIELLLVYIIVSKKEKNTDNIDSIINYITTLFKIQRIINEIKRLSDGLNKQKLIKKLKKLIKEFNVKIELNSYTELLNLKILETQLVKMKESTNFQLENTPEIIQVSTFETLLKDLPVIMIVDGLIKYLHFFQSYELYFENSIHNIESEIKKNLTNKTEVTKQPEEIMTQLKEFIKKLYDFFNLEGMSETKIYQEEIKKYFKELEHKMNIKITKIKEKMLSSLKGDEKQKMKKEIKKSRKEVGEHHLEKGNTEKAKKHFKKAKKHKKVAEIHKKSGNKEKAIKHYQKEIDKIKKKIIKNPNEKDKLENKILKINKEIESLNGLPLLSVTETPVEKIPTVTPTTNDSSINPIIIKPIKDINYLAANNMILYSKNTDNVYSPIEKIENENIKKIFDKYINKIYYLSENGKTMNKLTTTFDKNIIKEVQHK
jgi:hypothetical protein